MFISNLVNFLHRTFRIINLVYLKLLITVYFPPGREVETLSDLLTVSSETSRVPVTNRYFIYLLNKMDEQQGKEKLLKSKWGIKLGDGELRRQCPPNSQFC